ncbi:MAG: hypothetical protein HY318_15565 [Armatimonadetes bacterium]|nr:hypothetical protein [Armatimonadota bacterium]
MVEIKLTGTPRQIGGQRGEQLKYAVHFALEHYVPGHAHQWSLAAARAHGQRMAEDMSKRWPEVIDEVISTAVGAEIPEDDMLAYVFRAWNALTDHPSTLACYSMTCRDPGRGLIMAGVLEDGPPFYLLERVSPVEGVPFFSVTWAGMPWSVRSMNKAGLAIGQASSFAGIRFREGTHKFPFDLYARGFFAERCAIQNATTVSEGVDILRSFECGSTFMLTDASGTAVTLEACGKLHALRDPDDLGIMTGGVFESPELIKSLIDEGIAHDWEEGIRKAKRVSSRLREAHGQTTMEWMAAYLQAEQTDGGWCHDGLQSATIACPTTGEFWVSGYRPCASGFKEYATSDL